MADKRIVFFGNERLATGVTTDAPTFQALLDNGYEIAVLVVAQNTAGPSRKGRDLEIVRVAERHGVEVLRPQNLSEIVAKLKEYKAEIGVLVAFGKIVPPEVIDIFPRGIVNIHPSLLPEHRGPTPIESVMLRGDSKTGVSLMQLAPQMDAGPVYAQEKVELKGDETKQELADQLLNVGKAMLVDKLPKILDGSLKPESQDDTKATYDKKLEKEFGNLDFKHTATMLERMVRAYAGWPRSRVIIGTREVIVTKARADNDINGVVGTLWLENNLIGMHAAEGNLIIEKLIPAGKKEMDARAFLAGYHP
jgi:methionyl-tRNA formyltransferase